MQLAGGTVVGEEVLKTKVAAWHAAGFTGVGIRIGIIDAFHSPYWDPVQFAGEVPSPSGTFCRINGAACSVWSGGAAIGWHGVAVAEIVHEMAPDARLYLATASSRSDLQAVVNYFISQGVDIISRSQTAPYDGPGDGTGPIASVQNSAVAAGIAWFNSAGNSGGVDNGVAADAGSYWRAGWADTDGDGWLDFLPGAELLPFHCGFINGIRWSDWGANRTDYDVYVFDEPTDPTAIAWSEADQAAGADPIEHPKINGTSEFGCTDDVDYLAIYRFAAGSGTSGDVIEFMTNGAWVDLWSNQHSAAGPLADTANPGALTVGAVDPPLGSALAPYSAHGPTNDGRIKPDLSAAACVTVLVLVDCFNGTSAATPVAAAAAAVILDSAWVSTPSSLKSFLKTYLVHERGQAGQDNDFGAGELVLTSFVDTVTSTFVAHIEWIAEEGITTGCAPGFYCPRNSVTRGQMAAFLNRALDLPPATRDHFTDDEGSTFEAHINAVAEAGITGGCTRNTYCPLATVTRGQMAAFLRRALDLPAASDDYFTDDESSTFELHINAVAEAGITGGCTATTFCPTAPVTRGQMAAFLRRALE